MINKEPFLIGEIGINHNGSINIAKKLITLAKNSGLDAVKFQKRDCDICVPKEQREKLKDTPWGTMTYFDYKKKIEFGLKEYKEIDKFCKSKKIEWFASAWDINSLNFLKKFRLRYNKIPSALISNTELIIEVAKQKKKTFISTGGADLIQIKKIVNIFKKYKCPYVLMHCVAIYPAEDEILNLSYIDILKKNFGNYKVGYSGHESTVLPTLIAMSMGAVAIERHITLDRAMWGTDQSASLSRPGMEGLVAAKQRMKLILGNKFKTKKKYLKIEEKKLKTMKYW
jgi:N-acetylneuraminate synthase